MRVEYGRAWETAVLEDAASGGDRALKDLLSLTMLGKIGSDCRVLHAASSYMGPRTRLMQAEADKALGLPVD